MTKDMTEGPIIPQLTAFTIPLVLGNLFQLTYNAADSVIVGKFLGDDALAAVGSAGPVMNLMILFISGMCMGAGILTSTQYGAKRYGRLERQVSTTMIGGLVFSAVISLLLLLISRPLLWLLQVPEDILELNRRLEPHKERDSFLPFERLSALFAEYPVLVGAGHPFREGGHIPELPEELLRRFDFLDLNGKDIAADREETERKTYELARRLRIPVVAGSDTHQAVQYGCIRTRFEKEFGTVEEMRAEMKKGGYEIVVSDYASFQVRTAGLLKRALKEIHAIGGDYVHVLLQGAE